MAPNIIFYRYPESPFAQQVDVLLAIRKIPHKTVPVARIPPRPELKMLGIDYRRIPLLAINETVYCDTFAIAQALEDAFPVSAEHPSIFPADKSGTRNVGAQKALVLFWTNKAIFNTAALLLPWTKLPAEFIKDRGEYRGTIIDPEKIESMHPYHLAQLSLHLELSEEQLEGRSFFFDTERPGYADAAVFFTLKWMEGLGITKDLVTSSTFPNVAKFVERMKAFMSDEAASFPSTEVSASDAASALQEASSSAPAASTLDFDEAGAMLINVKRGQDVTVTPDDTGKVATEGKLVGLTRRLVTIEVERREGGGVTRVAFPRLGFVIAGNRKPKM